MVLIVSSYVPDVTDLLSNSFWYKNTQFIVIVNSNYHNFVCYFATNAIISMKNYFQALYLIFYLQKKVCKTQRPNYVINQSTVIFIIYSM